MKFEMKSAFVSGAAALFLLAAPALAQPGPAAGTLTAAPTVALPPTVTPVPVGNHYLCYNVKDEKPFQPVSVMLKDQFGNREVRVIAVTRLCTPVMKQYAGHVSQMVNPQLHLVCYQISPSQPANRRAIVTNQFGQRTLRIYDPIELCLPSSKQLIPLSGGTAP